MGILDALKPKEEQQPQADQLTPAPEQPVAPEAPQQPAPEATPEPVANGEIKEDVPTDEEEEDRSAFNCSGCGGGGLIGDPTSSVNSICTQCNGTGKVA